jgi:hypothetical protein
MNLGREKLDWGKETWANIDKAVHDEAHRVRIAMKYIPICMTTSDALSIPADTIETVDQNGVGIPLMVDEGKTISIFEILTGFSMTKQQVSREGDVKTAITLATRATNILMQGEDILMFQGDDALEKSENAHPLFKSGRIRHRNNSFGPGLLGAVAGIPQTSGGPSSQTILVYPTRVDTETVALNRYGENTFGAVSEAYSRLQSKGHYGPYALALHSDIYADTFAPLPTTLIMPADRIKPLVTAGFHGTGTLPFRTGVLVSLGGNTMDLVVGMDAITVFLQEDTEGLYQFRVFERFTLRLKDDTAVIKLEFERE